jgi:hypothetical protein
MMKDRFVQQRLLLGDFPSLASSLPYHKEATRTVYPSFLLVANASEVYELELGSVESPV